MDNQYKSLEEIRSNILKDIAPLLTNSTFNPEQKFTLLLAAARMSGKAEDFKSAYEAAKSIEDDNEKANSLFELLEEIDIQLGEISFEPDSQPEEIQAETGKAN